MNNILISGITGFIGSNLNRYLKNDFNIYGLSRKSNSRSTTFNYDDLGDVLDKSIAFLHLAGKAHDLKQTGEEKEYFEVNLDLTKKLFDQFLLSECKVFVYLSSVKAAADSVIGLLAEDYTPNPSTAYGRSKLAAEQFITTQNIPVNKKFYILRPCMIHGPGNKGNLNLLYNLVSKGLPWPLGSFENKRSYLSIENLYFIIKELIEREDIPSGVYNVADDESISTNDLISLIAESKYRKPQIWKISKSFIQFVAKIGDILRLPLNSERLQKLTESYVVSNKKINSAIGKELPISAKDGLIKTLNSFNNGQ